MPNDDEGVGPLGLGIPLGVCQLPRCGQPVPQAGTGRPALYHSTEHKVVADKLRRRYGSEALTLAAADPTFDPDAPGPPRLRRVGESALATFPGDIPEPLAVLVEGVRAANQAVPALVAYLAERSETGMDARLRQAEEAAQQERIRREQAEFDARRAVSEADAAGERAQADMAAAAADVLEAEAALERAEQARDAALEETRAAHDQRDEALTEAAEAQAAREVAREETTVAVAARQQAEAAHAEATQEVGRVRDDLASLRRELDEERAALRAAAGREAEAGAALRVTESRLEDATRRVAELEERLVGAAATADRRVAELEEWATAERERALDAQRSLTTAVELERDRLVAHLDRVTAQLERALAAQAVPGGPAAPGS